MDTPWTGAGLPLEELALDLNRIVTFLARRDIESLTKDALRSRAGIERVDLLLLRFFRPTTGCFRRSAPGCASPARQVESATRWIFASGDQGRGLRSSS
ncbi:hypothetical protein DAT35_48430 [Vitiosangium sp. GDMCC 1.1324]|nr:hypothetical protein DAT35_48430 [Vitiosangium sp. GDMCC 1.1324]